MAKLTPLETAKRLIFGSWSQVIFVQCQRDVAEKIFGLMASLRGAPGKVTELTFPQELVALQPCKKKVWKGHRNTVSISLMKLEVKRLLVSQIQFSFLNPEPPTATYISTLVLNFQLFYQCLSCRDFYNIAILHLAYVVVIIKGHFYKSFFLFLTAKTTPQSPTLVLFAQNRTLSPYARISKRAIPKSTFIFFITDLLFYLCDLIH